MRKTELFHDGLIFAAITAFIFVGAVLRGVNLLILIASLLTCFLIFDFFLGKMTLRRLKFQRTIPTNIFAGETFLMTIELTNERANLSSWMLVLEDRIELMGQETLSQETIERETSIEKLMVKRTSKRKKTGKEISDKKQSGSFSLLTYFRPNNKGQQRKKAQKYICRPVCICERLKRGETEKCIYAGRLPLRGRYRLGPTTVLTSFPFGFFRSSIVLGEEKEFAVFPKIGRLKKDWFRHYQRLSERQKRSFLKQTRTSDEPLGIRHWQTGDVRKWIHWRASAKHQEIFVRQFEERQNQQIVIIVDLFQPTPQTIETIENVEIAVSFAATLVKEVIHGSFSKMHFAVSGINEILSGKTSVSFSFSIMQLLTDVQASSNDSLAETIQNIALLTNSESTIILITTNPFNAQSSDRITALQNDPKLRRLLSKITVINVSDPEFDFLVL